MQKDNYKQTEIYVGNVPHEYCEDDVKNIFSVQKYKVVRVNLKKNDKNKTYAFVRFANGKQANEALDEYKNISLEGRKLVFRCSSQRNPQRNETKSQSASTSPIQNGAHSSNGINGHESDASDESNRPPPLVPIPQHILRMMIQGRNAALLSEKKPLEPIQITRNYGTEQREVQAKRPLLPTPVIKTPVVKAPVVETTKEIITDVKTTSSGSSVSNVLKYERIAKVIICDFPPGTTEVELLELFEIYCPVKCKVMVNSLDDSSEGFTYAFIFLPSGRVAASAATNLNGSVFKGEKISVKHVVLPDALL